MIASQYLIIAAVGIACVSGGVGYVKGKSDESDRHAQFRAEVAATNAKLQAENAARLRAAEQATSDIAAQSDLAIAGLARGYNSRLERLRVASASNCATLSLVASTTAQPDGPAKEPASGADPFTTACFETERDAANDAMRFRWLQHWVMEVCK